MNLLTRRTLLLAPIAFGGCALQPAPPAAAPTDLPGEGQHPWTIAVPGLPEPLRCWLYLPRGYAAAARPWPLVVFMHGSGERGTELDRVKAHGPPKHAARGIDYPFVLVSPQLDDGQHWQPIALHLMLPVLLQRLRVDPDRVIATGLSLGGIGAWDWATAYPGDLAAIAPVCGYGDSDDVCRAAHLPVRAYHGADDTVVPIGLERESVEALRACGGQVEHIVYPGVGLDAWNPAYEDPALVPWMLAQRRHR